MIFTPLVLVTAASESVAPEAGGTVGGLIQPSRLIADSADQQVELMRSRLAINMKDRGPFGLNQDPGKVGSTIDLGPVRRRAKKVVTPFIDVVRAVPVAAVFPAEQEFLVGYRSIRTGDTFPLVVRDEKISVRVESVHSRGVVFKNLKSGESATKRLDLLPEGITPGGKIQLINGVTPAGESSKEPLHIVLSTLPSADPTASP